MKLPEQEYSIIHNWMFRNARSIDLARWQYHFEGGSKDAVIRALSAYQNEDGGFGHALEADSWNPNSSPIQSWTATEIILELDGIDASSDLIQNTLHYLEKCPDFKNGYWLAEIPSNNDHPHAPWWHYEERSIMDWGYNPTACLAGFILLYAKPSSSILKQAEEIVKSAVADFLAGDQLHDQHEISCFIRLLEYCRLAKRDDLFDLKAFELKLRDQVFHVITRDMEQWKTGYVCKPSSFISSSKSPFYAENKDLVDYEINFILESREKNGVWGIAWDWPEYQEAFALSKNWWKSTLVVQNMRFLNAFGCF